MLTASHQYRIILITMFCSMHCLFYGGGSALLCSCSFSLFLLYVHVHFPFIFAIISLRCLGKLMLCRMLFSDLFTGCQSIQYTYRYRCHIFFWVQQLHVILELYNKITLIRFKLLLRLLSYIKVHLMFTSVS